MRSIHFQVDYVYFFFDYLNVFLQTSKHKVMKTDLINYGMFTA